jgi:hypothetical protein
MCRASQAAGLLDETAAPFCCTPTSPPAPPARAASARLCLGIRQSFVFQRGDWTQRSRALDPAILHTKAAREILGAGRKGETYST